MKAIVSATLGAAMLTCLAAPAPAVVEITSLFPPAKGTIVMKAVPPSKEAGKSVIHASPSFGFLVFSIMVSNEMPGAVQPAHIHRERCGSNGPILFKLTDVVGGKSNTTFHSTEWKLLKTGGFHHVNIHKSATDGTIVSCGEIPPMYYF